MDTITNEQLTFGQALSRKWQMPVFILSLAAFGGMLFMMRPERPVELTFDDKYQQLRDIALAGEYSHFYTQAEQLRQEAQTELQVARLHGLAAETRARELRSRREMGLESNVRKSADKNYQMVVDGYGEAFKFKIIDPNSENGAKAFRDISLAFWSLNEPDRAIKSLRLAIEARAEYDVNFHMDLVRMYLVSRPQEYLNLCLNELEQILVYPATSVNDRAWAFVRKAQILIAMNQEERALLLLESADAELVNTPSGEEIELMRGRALHYAGRVDEADQILRLLLGRMLDRGDIYAQVALELGKINYEQYRDFDAMDFYRLILQTQTGKDWMTAGLLGMGECAALQKRYEESLAFYRQAVDQVKAKPNNLAINAGQIQSSLAEQARLLGLLKYYGQAISYLDLEQELAPAEDIVAAYRYARMHARLADQLREQLNEAEQQDPQQTPSDLDVQWRTQQEQLMARHYEIAADHYLAVSQKVTGDKTLFSDSLWFAADCYDNAGNPEKSIETWKKFVNQQEGEVRWPEALKNLARSFQALGRFEDAIHYYGLLYDKHPNSPAALDSVIPMAQCYMLQAAPQIDKAETLLLSVLNNEALTPEAVYFRQAVFELGELYYQQGEYKKAISYLTEAIDRYPQDRQLGKCMFLVGDSFRKNAMALDETLQKLTAGGGDAISRENILELRRELLVRSENYFRQGVNFYENIAPQNYTGLDELYMRHCCLNRADCLFEMEQYEKAALQYEDVAMRYQLTPTALMAFTQIINCHLKLNNPEEARSANRRALWQLSKMPDDVLASSSMSLTRQQWQSWLNWTDNSGLW